MKKETKYKLRRIMLLYIPTLIIYIGMFDYGIWQACGR